MSDDNNQDPIIDNSEEFDEDDGEGKSFVVEAHKGVNIIGEKGNVFVKVDMDTIIGLPFNSNMIDNFHRFVGVISFYKNIFKTSFSLTKFKDLKLYVLAEVPKDALHPAVAKALEHKDIVIFQKGKPVSQEEQIRKALSTMNLKKKEG